MTEKQRTAQMTLLRRRAWVDFYVFAKYVAGKTLMEEEPHRELAEFMTKGLVESSILGIDEVAEPMTPFVINECKGLLKKLMMLPRNSFKSSIAQALICWLLWHNPNLRIMIDSETLGNSKLYLAGVKDLIANNELMREICVNEKGEYILEPNKKLGGGFVEDQVILLHRTRVGMKEPTLFCSGVDNARTGMHPDVIIMDDLVSERNVTTEDQIKKVEEHYRYSLSLLEIGGGLLFVIGTRYHMNDLYGQLIEGESLDNLVRPAVSEEGKLYFPKRLTEQFLAEMRKEQGSYIFFCQYMLNPVNQDDAIFKAKHVQYIEDLKEPPVIVDRYITVDPAISKKERADFTAIIVTGVDKEKRRYYEQLVRDKFSPNELLDKIFAVAANTPLLRGVGIETVAFQKVLIYNIKDEMRRRNKYLNIVELKADQDKVRRARMMQPAWENDDIYISRTHCSVLVNELLEFPMGKHDDTVDAAVYVEQMLKPLRTGRRKKPVDYKPTSSITGY